MKKLGQSLTGQIWDLLNVLWFEIKRRKDTDRIAFQMLVGKRRLDLVAVCHPGMDGEPVITIMLPGED